MKRKIGDFELLPYSLALLAMLMVAFPNLLLIGIICIVIALINVYRAKGLQFRFSWLNSFFVLFYLAYLVGVIYTNNEEWAYRYLEYKLSFIIFPILFSFIQGNKKELICIPILGLILGVCIVIIIGIFNAFDCYYTGGQFCFYSAGISPVHHPTYLSVYMLFGSVAIWYGFINKWNGYKLYWIIPFTAVAILFHYLCLSLAGILFLTLVIGISIIVLIKRRFGMRAAFFSILFIPILTYFLILKIPVIEGEWNGAKWYADRYIENPGEFVSSRSESMSGSEARLVMWTVAYQQFVDQPLGVGTGNVDEALSKKLFEFNQQEFAHKNLNPHNQFLQTAVEIGVIGLLLLLGVIFYSVFYSIKNRNWLLLLLIGSLAFNSLFESMLQRQSGIVFYTFWICLLASTLVSEKSKIKAQE